MLRVDRMKGGPGRGRRGAKGIINGPMGGMVGAIAKDQVPDRTGRESRCQKRCPKAHPFMIKPRPRMKDRPKAGYRSSFQLIPKNPVSLPHSMGLNPWSAQLKTGISKRKGMGENILKIITGQFFPTMDICPFLAEKKQKWGIGLTPFSRFFIAYSSVFELSVFDRAQNVTVQNNRHKYVVWQITHVGNAHAPRRQRCLRYGGRSGH